MEDTVGGNLVGLMERASLCVSGPQPGVAAHTGDEGFRELVEEHFTAAENNAVEELVQVKKKLRESSTYDFWSLLMEGMTSITGAQYGFVTKRILVDDQDTAVEMPPIGEPGSCLMGVAFYYNDGRDIVDLHRDFKYLAYGAPCHNMKHDKVFLIPNKLQDFVLNNPNNFPFPTDAYIGVPLFIDGKCFGHFGMMWTKEGVAKKKLSWAYIEMLLHSLEDVILERLEEGMGFSKGPARPSNIIPAEAVTAQQSLKPYARSLSHELRTPMQGVVGMLDVMHATVQESLEGQSDDAARKIFKTLRDNIEIVQDSSRRAVEAADNVVHAYDLNMQVPDTPNPPNDDENEGLDALSALSQSDKRPNIFIKGNSISFQRSKRRRSTSAEIERPAHKHRVLQSRGESPHTAALRTAVEESDNLTSGQGGSDRSDSSSTSATLRSRRSIDEMALDTPEADSTTATPGLRHTKVRDLLHLVVNESLRLGGRPESAVAVDTDGGEIIEVVTRNSDGEVSNKTVEWTVDPQVPDTMFVDERDLAKLVSCVFLNAIKFTDHGTIKVTATLSPKSRFIVINIKDTGQGIAQAFLPYLFKPYSREDDSLTRQKEGLGLGLLVAKGLARRIGGDLVCVRSDTTGPRKGSHFEMKVPITPSETHSRATSPAATPTPTPTPSRVSLDRPPILDQRGREARSADRRQTPRSRASPFVTSEANNGLPQATTPLLPASSSRRNSLSQQAYSSPSRRASIKKGKAYTFDRTLAQKFPLTFLVAEDNKINRQLLVSMLSKLGYAVIHEAHDGGEAVRQMSIDRHARGEKPIDVVLMDLWMPTMDGYEATEKILAMDRERQGQQGIIHRGHSENENGRIKRMRPGVTVLAVSADVTDAALERASEVGMEGFMTKPYKLLDLERLIVEHCAGDAAGAR
ncbi:MAG: hypothetical protein Q9169_001837 [Polycauliona sp. 2 TL-2023]